MIRTKYAIGRCVLEREDGSTVVVRTKSQVESKFLFANYVAFGFVAIQFDDHDNPNYWSKKL
jgi:hypothetical protein